ncbi:hypothetical protein BDQ17DRAFT_1357561 [Cyathus striatus]|nr:hypothetical protein BDQ17DRAFT_1357561 [Cyathus striatus]
MHAAPLLLLSFSALFSQVTCLAPRTLPLSQLLSRQTDPASCSSICSTILNTVQTCDSPDCLCTATNANQLGQCVNCTYNAPGADDTIKSQAVNTLNTFEATCAGYSIPSISISSAGPSSTPASASTSASLSNSALTSGTALSSASLTSTPTTQVVVTALSSSAQSTVGSSSTTSSASNQPTINNAAIAVNGSPFVATTVAFSLGLGMLFML